MELGVYTFAELAPGRPPEERLRELLEEIELAEQAGLDVFGVGEHHRSDFVVSTPAVVLAAAAARTERIRLTSAVTVLSSDDPVRASARPPERRSTVANSRKRSWPAAARSSSRSRSSSGLPPTATHTGSGSCTRAAGKRRARGAPRGAGPDQVTRSPARSRSSSFKLLGEELVVVGEVEADSAVRAGRLGLPLALAIIGGQPERFVPFAELHRRAAAEAGHERLPLSINSHGFVGESSEAAATFRATRR